MKNKAAKPWSQGKAKLPLAWFRPFVSTLSLVPTFLLLFNMP